MTQESEKTVLALTVKQVREAFDSLEKQGYSNAKISVVVDRGFASMGARHMTDITGIHVGIDWEKGRIILNTAERLSVADDKLDALRAKVEASNSALYSVRSVLDKREYSDETKLALLKKQIALFEERLHEADAP